MIKLVANADSKLKTMLNNKSVLADYYQTCESYARGYTYEFVAGLQKLLTDLGIIMSQLSNGPSISYCARSIDYLCKKVLDNPSLIKTFFDVGINEKGNEAKHSIKEVKIDMLRAVTTYNNLVNRIAGVYGLKDLEQLVVKKQIHGAEKNDAASQSRNPAVSKKPVGQRYQTKQREYVDNREKRRSRFSETSRPKDTASLADGNLKVKASLEKGDGRYVKGLFVKKNYVNFKLSVSIRNENGLKVSKVVAFIKGKNASMEKKISTDLESLTVFDLPVESYGGNIEASVFITYKLGLFKAKQMKVTVSKNF